MMAGSKLRRQIAWEAARLLYARDESEYYQAKMKAARRVQKGWVRPADLPSNVEIRDEVRQLARLHEGPAPHDELLYRMRLRAAWWLGHLEPFHPKLIGSVLTGHVREGSDIDIHAFASGESAVTARIEETGCGFDVERKRLRKDGEERTFIHVHISDEFPVEVTIYSPRLMGHRFKSSITGKPIERAGLAHVRRLIELEHQRDAQQLNSALGELDTRPDRWQLYQSLLLPLENVRQKPQYHPEGDVLYHSLQVYELAKDEMPYDEEFLLAALLHDVGKAIDPGDHVAAGLEALEGFIEPRTAWLIENHMLCHGLRDGSLGRRARRRLREHPWFEDLVSLGECDYGGRQAGVQVPDVDEALDYIRSIEEMFGA